MTHKFSAEEMRLLSQARNTGATCADKQAAASLLAKASMDPTVSETFRLFYRTKAKDLRIDALYRSSKPK